MVLLPHFADKDPDERYFDPAFGGEVRRLRQGGCMVIKDQDVLTTLLGSCVALCLRDPLQRIGGMIHFLIPAPPKDGPLAPRLAAHGCHPYGEQAMDELCRRLQVAGADLDGLEAKLFGGAEVLSILGAIGQRNIACAENFLRRKGLSLQAADVGGGVSRRIYYQPYSGRVWVRRKSGDRWREMDTSTPRIGVKTGRQP
jgi:chemotaxis protein CheD